MTVNSTLVSSGPSIRNDSWALNVSSIVMNYDYYSYGSAAVLASDFPYITLPERVWQAFKSNLTDAGFVCFRSAYEELSSCIASTPCSEFATSLDTLTISTYLDDGFT